MAALLALLSVGCGTDAEKAAKDAADKAKAAKEAADKAAKELTGKLKDSGAADALKQATEALAKEVTGLKGTAEADVKAVETKIAAMKADAAKLEGDKKKEAEGKVTEANGLLDKVKEQLGQLGGLKDMASFTALKDKLMGLIADLKKKVGL